MSELDEIIFRLALDKAKRLVADGRSVDRAVEIACPGSWQSLRDRVRQRLQRGLSDAA